MHKMMSSSKGKDFQAKQEDNNDNDKIEKGKMATTRSSWSGLKDPRVVRVSRTFGGKDRHSKVCTVRGLRDRRVRLSVPTAIQLYDLQDRLGLNQPSKVVDWLLNAAKDDIDELPPLQIPPGIFGQYSQSMVVTQGVNDQMQSCFSPLVDSYMKSDSSHLLQSNKEGFTISDNIDIEDQTSEQPKSRYWNLNSVPLISSKSKEASHETANDQRTNWMSPKRSNMEQGISQEDGNVQNAKVVSSHFLIPRITTNLSSLPSLQDSVIPQNSFGHWDPSNLSLSNLGSTTQSGYSSSQTEDPSSSPSPLSLPSSTSQYLVYPSGTTPTFFQPYATTHQHPLDSNPIRQLNYFHMMSSTAGLQTLPVNTITPSPYPNSSGNPIMRPFHMGVISDPSKLLHPQNNNGSQPNKGSNTSSTSFT